jgi:hypothetical protein
MPQADDRNTRLRRRNRADERNCIAALLKRAPQLSDETGKDRSPLTRDLPRLIRAFDPLVREDSARLSEDDAVHGWVIGPKTGKTLTGRIAAGNGHTPSRKQLQDGDDPVEGSRTTHAPLRPTKGASVRPMAFGYLNR